MAYWSEGRATAQQLPCFCPPASADAPHGAAARLASLFSLRCNSLGRVVLRSVACERRKCAINAFVRCGLRKAAIECKVVEYPFSFFFLFFCPLYFFTATARVPRSFARGTPINGGDISFVIFVPNLSRNDFLKNLKEELLVVTNAVICACSAKCISRPSVVQFSIQRFWKFIFK